jgi:hypothetical protein
VRRWWRTASVRALDRVVTQRRGEVFADVVAVAGQGGRFQHPGFAGEPAVEVVGHGFAVAEVDPQLCARRVPAGAASVDPSRFGFLAMMIISLG